MIQWSFPLFSWNFHQFWKPENWPIVSFFYPRGSHFLQTVLRTKLQCHQESVTVNRFLAKKLILPWSARLAMAHGFHCVAGNGATVHPRRAGQSARCASDGVHLFISSWPSHLLKPVIFWNCRVNGLKMRRNDVSCWVLNVQAAVSRHSGGMVFWSLHGIGMGDKQTVRILQDTWFNTVATYDICF